MTAALVVPTMILYLLLIEAVLPHAANRFERAAAWGVATLIYGAYLVAVIGGVARDQRRRRAAMLVALAAVLIDAAYSWYTSTPLSNTPELLDKLVFALLLVAYVAAWGIARRQHPSWRVGLAVAAIVAAVSRFCDFGQDWLSRWVGYPGMFVVGCLVCWAFDAGTRLSELERAASTEVTQITP